MADYLVDKLLPRHEASVLAGASGTGKTYFVMQMLAALQKGEPFFGLPTRSDQKIAFLNCDRGSYEHHAEACGVDLSQIRVRSLIRDEGLDPEDFRLNGIKALLRMLNSVTPCDLAVVDPFGIAATKGTLDFKHMACDLASLQKWCWQKKVTLLLIHHAAKSRTDYSYSRSQDRTSGSGAIQGYSSTQMFLDSPDETGDPHHNFQWNDHFSGTGGFKLLQLEGGTFKIWTPESTEADVLSQRILSVFTDTHLSYNREYIVAAVQTMGEHPERTIDRRLTELLETGYLTKPRRGFYSRTTVA